MNNNAMPFYPLEILSKTRLTPNTFAMELVVPETLKPAFRFQSGQYIKLGYEHQGQRTENDFSITSAPHEGRLALGIKINDEHSSAKAIWDDYQVGQTIDATPPKGRFVLTSKPDEFRTILGFAAGIGITPLLSHFKNILYNEPRTRLFLFYGNKDRQSVAFREELESLKASHAERLEIYYFYSKDSIGNAFFEGRLDEKKLALIINQILMIDDTDEESTLWDAVDEVLICGKGEMIKSIANACYNNGIPKRNIHFELFQAFNDDIFPVEVSLPLIKNIEVEFLYNGKTYRTTLDDNRNKLLQSLSIKGFPVPFSCKSGICGSCECRLEEGQTELLENEYLTEREEAKGNILPCMAIPLSNKIRLNFDNY